MTGRSSIRRVWIATAMPSGTKSVKAVIEMTIPTRI